jgi:predicted phosphodiesterase
MRVAIVSDIHGNLTAWEAVLDDIRSVAPDVVLHAGDLADGGSSPAAIVDCIRAFGWAGVQGNGDEMLSRPESLDEFISQSTAPPTLWYAVREMAAWTRASLGKERLSWLGQLPLALTTDELAVVHASPDHSWKGPAANATDADLERTYGVPRRPTVVFGHTHLPGVRRLGETGRLVINSGSVGLPYDGDPRAAYLLLENGTPQIRRVSYDTQQEVDRLHCSGLPHAEWVARMLRAASPRMP